MATHSAGIILYRTSIEPESGGLAAPQVEILLVHPGGPYWAKKDTHGWSIPKGEYDPTTEAALSVAEREFEEELGSPAPEGDRLDLGSIKASSKLIRSWLVEGDFDPTMLVSNSFEIEWPPKSGQMQQFPEVDRCQWFDLAIAEAKLHKGQLPLVETIRRALA